MRESEKYLGLPTPANAILLCSLILFIHKMFSVSILLTDSILYDLFGSLLLYNEYIILLISMISSILLLSKINYEKFPLISFKVNRRNNIDLLKIIFFLVLLFVSVYFSFYELVLLIFTVIYIYGNLFKHVINKIIK